jgi:hypothetical protein
MIDEELHDLLQGRMFQVIGALAACGLIALAVVSFAPVIRSAPDKAGAAVRLLPDVLRGVVRTARDTATVTRVVVEEGWRAEGTER